MPAAPAVAVIPAAPAKAAAPARAADDFTNREIVQCGQPDVVLHIGKDAIHQLLDQFSHPAPDHFEHTPSPVIPKGHTDEVRHTYLAHATESQSAVYSSAGAATCAGASSCAWNSQTEPCAIHWYGSVWDSGALRSP